jgi:hypothetical protein
MPVPLITDLKNDKRWVKNLLRVLGFILFFFFLDFLVSAFMLRGAERFYGLKSDADILMIGHSHLMLAVDKMMLEEESGLKVAKYTRKGVNMADRMVMVEHYYSVCKTKPESVILSIDPWLFTGEGLSQNSWKLFLPFMDNREVDDYIKTSSNSRFDYLRYRLIRSSRFDVGLLNAASRGWLNNWDNLKFGTIDTIRYSNKETLSQFRPISINQELADDFVNVLDFLHKENIKLLLLNTPIWKPLVDVNSQDYERSIDMIEKLKSIHCPSAIIIDMVPEFSERTELFYDPIHLNPQGQKVITQRLIDYFKEYSLP